MTPIETASTVARKSALAYVGALALTGDAARDSFEQLSQRGADTQQLLREQAQKLASRLRRRAAAPAAAPAEALPAEAPAEPKKALTLLAQGRDRLLERLQIPTQASLAELNSEIERLSAAIDDLRVKSRRQPSMPEPLPGYEKMNVDTVLSQLPKLDQAGLLSVQAYEQAHQGRVTVLRGVERTLSERQAEPVGA